MDTDGIASRLFAVVRPQPEIQQVYAKALRDMLKTSAMLFECGLHDELGNWQHQQTQNKEPSWTSL